MTANPDSALRQALVAAEKALAEAGAVLADMKTRMTWSTDLSFRSRIDLALVKIEHAKIAMATAITGRSDPAIQSQDKP